MVTRVKRRVKPEAEEIDEKPEPKERIRDRHVVSISQEAYAEMERIQAMLQRKPDQRLKVTMMQVQDYLVKRNKAYTMKLKTEKGK